MTTSGAYGSHEIHEIKLTENKNRNGRTVNLLILGTIVERSLM